MSRGDGAPPLFVIHGDNDTLTPVEGARHLVSNLRASSTQPVAYAELPGAQHFFDVFHSIRFDTVVNAIEAFAAAGTEQCVLASDDDRRNRTFRVLPRPPVLRVLTGSCGGPSRIAISPPTVTLTECDDGPASPPGSRLGRRGTQQPQPRCIVGLIERVGVEEIGFGGGVRMARGVGHRTGMHDDGRSSGSGAIQSATKPAERC